MGGAVALHSSPTPPGVPSHLPLLFSPQPPFYAPKDPHDLDWALEGRGLPWELSRLPGPKWAGQTTSASLPFLLDGPSHLPLLIFPASLLCPQDPHGLRGALEVGELAWELSRLPARVGQVIALHSFPALPRESHLPLLISPASGAPILSGLHSSSPASVPLCHTEVPPVFLGVIVPH